MSRSGKRGNLLTWVVGAGIVVFLALALLNFWRAKEAKPRRIREEKAVPVSVAEVRKEALARILEVTGDLFPSQAVELYPKVAGRIIEKIFVEKGDRVHKGDRVVSLEKDLVLARLARTRAALEVARTQTVLLEKDRARVEALYRKKAVSRQKLDHIRAELDASRARTREAEAALKELSILLRDHDIYATCSGTVVARFVDPGNYTDTKKPILRIFSMDPVKILAAVPASRFPLLRKGLTCTFQVDAHPDRTFRGRVALVYPAVDPVTRTAQVEIHAPNPDRLLRAGMFAHVRILLGKRTCLTFPRDGLNRMPGTGSYYVYVVEKGRARIRNIKTGLLQGNRVEVIQGLSAGEQVVVRGQNRLKQGSLVHIVRDSLPPQP